MKKNLNIAYLNGAEGMIRRGGASSGGSGESGGSNNETKENIYYYKIDNNNPLVYFSNRIKTKNNNNDDIWITSTAKWVYEWYESGAKDNSVCAIEVQYPIEDYYTNDVPIILNNLEEAVDYFSMNISDCTPITKEEFYSLEQTTISFNVGISESAYKGEDIQDASYIVKTYECELGMTFEQWFDSKYNVDNIKPFTVDGQIEQGKVIAPFLDYDVNYGCTIYGYSGVGIEFKYPIEGYFYDRTVNTPNGQETCQLIITH